MVGSPNDSARSPASNPSRSDATTAARRGNCARVVACENPTSSNDSSGRAIRCARNRSACARKPCSPLAETSTGTTGGDTGATSSGSASAGASSMITCAFVPLTPNEDTAARRGRPATTGHGSAWVSNRTCPDSQST